MLAGVSQGHKQPHSASISLGREVAKTLLMPRNSTLCDYTDDHSRTQSIPAKQPFHLKSVK